MCFPRANKVWDSTEPPKDYGLSLLPLNPRLRKFTARHIFVFNEGKIIPKELILYQTAVEHYSLEPSFPMEMDGMSFYIVNE